MVRTKKGLKKESKKELKKELIEKKSTEIKTFTTKFVSETEERPFSRVKPKRTSKPKTTPRLTLEEKHLKIRRDQLMNPQLGEHVLYVEFGSRNDGKNYRNVFMGVVCKIVNDEENPEIKHFWAEFPSYRNHYYAKTPTPSPIVHDDGEGRVLIYFDHEYLNPKTGISTCYLNKFCKHLEAPTSRYLNDKIIATYLVARTNKVVTETWCCHGKGCTNDKIGHLINFKHIS